VGVSLRALAKHQDVTSLLLQRDGSAQAGTARPNHQDIRRQVTRICIYHHLLHTAVRCAALGHVLVVDAS
jgi:hypothetical protein